MELYKIILYIIQIIAAYHGYKEAADAAVILNELLCLFEEWMNQYLNDNDTR